MQDVLWADVRVGDIVLVNNKESVPADFLVLATGSENGVCHIETSNLDG